MNMIATKLLKYRLQNSWLKMNFNKRKLRFGLHFCTHINNRYNIYNNNMIIINNTITNLKINSVNIFKLFYRYVY